MNLTSARPGLPSELRFSSVLVPLLAVSILAVLLGCSAVRSGGGGGSSDDDDSAGAQSKGATGKSSTELVCDRDYLSTFQQLAQQASTSVDIAQWELIEGWATDDVVGLLAQAVARGIPVRVVLDATIEASVEAFPQLIDAGVDARLHDGTSRIHTKMVIADGTSALVGSTNWSTSAIQYNRECNLLLADGDGPGYLQAWFDQLWEDPDQRSSPAIAQANVQTLALVDDDLLPSLLERIDAATTRIDFTLYATYLQPTNLKAPAMQFYSALTEAAARGVAVRGVADWSDWNVSNSEQNQDAVSWLTVRGVSVRWDAPDTILHAKTFLIDEDLQVQSANVSSSGFRDNHESGAVTSDSAVVSDYEAWFDLLWAESTLQAPGR